jgi:hypothetical protein
VLPLLQFALTEVWKKRDVRRLTLAAYKELGKDDNGEQRGIEGVLDRRADEIYRGLTPEDQELCRRLFLRLVQPGEETEDTKRRVSFRELLPADPARAEALKKLVRTLADRDARLITTEGTDEADGTVEVAHEALISGWTQLRQWVDAERAGLRYRLHLTEAAQEWARAKPEHKEAYLYSGMRQAVCGAWIEMYRDDLTPTEAAFLEASEEAEQKRMQHELENERRLREAAEAREREAEEAAERQRRLGFRFLTAAVVAAALAVTSGMLALREYKARNDANNATEDAKAKARTSESRRLAALSESERGKRMDRALLLAVEANRFGTENTFEARNSLFKLLLTWPGLTSFLHADEGGVGSMAFSPDGKTLAAGYDTERAGGIVLWDVGQRSRLGDKPLAVPEGRVRSVAFSPDGKTLAAGYSTAVDGGVALWDVGQRSRLGDKPLAVAEAYHGVDSVAFSPDGKTLAAGYDTGVDGGVMLWDVDQRAPLIDKPLFVTEGRVSSVAFSPDSKTLAAGYSTFEVDGGGGVLLWDVGQRSRLGYPPLVLEGSFVRSVASTPDGKTLAAGYSTVDAGGGVVLLDVSLEAGERVARQLANRNFTRAEWRQYFPGTLYRPTFNDLPVPPETERSAAPVPEAAAPDAPK